MYVVGVTIKVKPECAEAFLAASIDDASNSRKEPGCLRFDVSRGENDPNTFFYYEVYKDQDAFAAHQHTPHFFRWREAVKDLMAEPRVGVRYLSVYPPEAGW
jgi:autoinducer 2-degrading protein